MTQKTKTIILVAIIIFATIGFGIFMIQRDKSVITSQPPMQVTLPSEIKKDESPQATPGEQKRPQEIKTISISGTVSVITKDFIEIDNSGSKVTLPFASDVAVLSVEGSKIEKKAITDIKKGNKVSVMLNSADSSIISIQIGKDAGNAF